MAASAAHVFVSYVGWPDVPAQGASGAVAAVLVAFVFLYPRHLIEALAGHDDIRQNRRLIGENIDDIPVSIFGWIGQRDVDRAGTLLTLQPFAGQFLRHMFGGQRGGTNFDGVVVVLGDDFRHIVDELGYAG